MPFSPTEPALIQCWQADVKVSPLMMSQPGPLGLRNVYPIAGGDFTGTVAPEGPAPRPFAGTIVPGGFDLQRVRADGLKELEAVYHLLTDDGVYLEIQNRALVIYGADGRQSYSRSRISIEAPIGSAYEWFNTRVIVGTTEVMGEKDGFIIVRVRGFAAI